MNIEISLHSLKLIKKYLLAAGVHPRELRSISLPADFITLMSWLDEELIKNSEKSSKEEKQKIEFILVSLRTELLRDLFLSMQGDDTNLPKEVENNTKEKMKFVVLTMAGILVAACQGFDGIVTMLSIFSLPSSIILGIGFAFSFLSVIVFCGFDLVRVSNALGIKLSDAYKLLDAYLLQLQMIKSIRKKIDDYYLSDLSSSDLKQLELIISMLQKHFALLTKASTQFEKALNSESIQTVKTLISGLSALLFFGGGFFTGQSVALFMSSLIINSAIPPFWPVIIFSVLVGLAALSIYWYVERPVLDKLVSSWFGLNEESVKKLCDKHLIIKEEKKLDHLEGKVISAARVPQKKPQPEQLIDEHESQEHNESVHERVNIGARVSTNYYSFLKPLAPPDPLPAILIEEENFDTITCCSI
ncbi:hypothetical protein FOLKNPGA_00213 [Legionella sp. PC1000]|uniref:hypothetical protein n=1 Tax=Legionella sp. PC1000 TaxID=2746060 RepID=UPI0015F9048F|nr:hypothetical protein [Legionella sp. PC1000]QLZ67448.1 hypothetical protein FOLKNPGA_00213 [Legionella sp. PC1000]